MVAGLVSSRCLLHVHDQCGCACVGTGKMWDRSELKNRTMNHRQIAALKQNHNKQANVRAQRRTDIHGDTIRAHAVFAPPYNTSSLSCLTLRFGYPLRGMFCSRASMRAPTFLLVRQRVLTCPPAARPTPAGATRTQAPGCKRRQSRRRPTGGRRRRPHPRWTATGRAGASRCRRPAPR